MPRGRKTMENIIKLSGIVNSSDFAENSSTMDERNAAEQTAEQTAENKSVASVPETLTETVVPENASVAWRVHHAFRVVKRDSGLKWAFCPVGNSSVYGKAEFKALKQRVASVVVSITEYERGMGTKGSLERMNAAKAALARVFAFYSVNYGVKDTDGAPYGVLEQDVRFLRRVLFRVKNDGQRFNVAAATEDTALKLIERMLYAKSNGFTYDEIVVAEKTANAAAAAEKAERDEREKAVSDAPMSGASTETAAG